MQRFDYKKSLKPNVNAIIEIRKKLPEQIQYIEGYLGVTLEALLILVLDWAQQTFLRLPTQKAREDFINRSFDIFLPLFEDLLNNVTDDKLINVLFKIIHFYEENSYDNFIPLLRNKIQQLENQRRDILAKSLKPLVWSLEGFKSPEKSVRGFFIADTFELYLSAKNPQKTCVLSADPELKEGEPTLHARQSLAERLIDRGTSNIYSITPENTNFGRQWPSHTYVLATLGFAFSDQVHRKGGDHKRIFRTKSIAAKGHTTFKCGDNLHAEEVFYKVLNASNFLTSLLQLFKNTYDLKAGHKIYAMVLDLHATYDMCVYCVNKTKEFTMKFMSNHREKFEEAGFVLSSKNNFKIIIRYSSDIYYTQNPERGKMGDRYNGILHVNDAKNNKDQIARIKTPLNIRNLSPTLPGVCFHGSKAWHNFWHEAKRRQQAEEKPPIKLEKWTAFASSSAGENTQFDYTKEGFVEQTLPEDDKTELEKPMTKLGLK